MLVTILILAQFGQVQFFDVFADDSIPNWVVKLSEFWDNGDITDKEFSNALRYLQDQKIVELVMGSEYDPITNFLLTMSEKEESILLELSNCSSDWYITGYFTPIESDYSGNFIRMQFDDHVKHFKSDFLDAVKNRRVG